MTTVKQVRRIDYDADCAYARPTRLCALNLEHITSAYEFDGSLVRRPLDRVVRVQTVEGGTLDIVTTIRELFDVEPAPLTDTNIAHSYGSLYQPGPGGSPGRFLTLEELRENYKRIVRIIDDACEAAETQEPPIRGAINWADLSCADVGIKNDGYYAVIEEAAPGCIELIEFVQDRLQAADFGNVDVTTEW